MSSFHLLTFPLELRDRVYEYIFISGSLPTVLILSHQVRREAIQLLHRKATYSGLFTYDRIGAASTVPQGHCTRLHVVLPNENFGPRRGRDFDAFYDKNQQYLMQDNFMVIVEYGTIARGLLVPVDLGRIREVEYWWPLIQGILRHGRS